MQRLFYLLLTVAILFSADRTNAQIRKIPSEVTDSFKVKYPSATKVSWKDKLTAFQASFVMDGSNYTAKFNTKGEWSSSEKEIAEANLPASVKDGLAKSKYADWKIKNVYTLYLPGDKTQYHITVFKGDLQKKNLLFSAEGQLLKDSITL